MKLIKKYMPLNRGEKVSITVKGSAYTSSPNVILRILGLLLHIISLILGSPSKLFVYVTNYRVIVIRATKFLWFFEGPTTSYSIAPQAISLLGYSSARSFIFFRSHYLELSGSGFAFNVRSKSGKENVSKAIKLIALLDADKLIRGEDVNSD